MRVTENRQIDGLGIKRKIEVPFQCFRPPPLIKAALKKNSLMIDIEDELGAGCGPGCSAELHLHIGEYAYFNHQVGIGLAHGAV